MAIRYFRITPDLATTGAIQITVTDTQGETTVYGSYTNPNPDASDNDFTFVLTVGASGRQHTATLTQDAVCAPTLIPFASLTGNAKLAADQLLAGGGDTVCQAIDDTQQPPCGTGIGCVACASKGAVVCSKCAPVFFSVAGTAGSDIQFGVSGSTASTTRQQFDCSFNSDCPPPVFDNSSSCPGLSVDLGFLIDTTGPLSDTIVDEAMYRLMTLVSRFDVGPSSTRVGWGQLLPEGRFLLYQDLQQSFNKRAVFCDMDAMSQGSKAGSLHTSLDSFAASLFNPGGDAPRVAVARVLIIVSDADQATPRGLANAVATLQTLNVKTVVISVLVSSFPQANLDQIWGDATTYSVETDEDVLRVLKLVGEALCSIAVGINVADLQSQPLAAISIPAGQVNYYQLQPLPFQRGTATVTITDLTGSTAVYGR